MGGSSQLPPGESPPVPDKCRRRWAAPELECRPPNEQVVLLADIASTGFSAAERGNIRLGDSVAVFAQGPIGLCATLGARLLGAAEIIAVDPGPARLQMSVQFGATRANVC